MTRIVVALSPRLFSEALARALQQYPEIDVVTWLAAGGTEVAEAVTEIGPEIALVDYALGGMDGPAVTRAIRSSAPEVKVLLFSWVHGPDQVGKALAAGAVGFLPKSLSVAQVVEALRQARQGRGLVYAEELTTLVEDIDRRGQLGDELLARLESLSRREVEILALLSEGWSTTELARRLSITSGTLNNYLSRMLATTGARTKIELIAWARSANIVPHPRAPRL